MSKTRNLPAMTLGLAAIACATPLAFVQKSQAQIEGPTIYADELVTAEWDRFGNAIDISGSTVIVGARLEDSTGLSSFGPGAAYVFENGVQEAKLTASPRNNGDEFGAAVAIEGNVAVVGAPADSVGAIASGAAYVYTRSGALWSEPTTLLGTPRALGDRFGTSVAIDGNRIVVGADRFFTGGDGLAYVFEFNGLTWVQTAVLTPSGGSVGPRFGGAVAVSGGTIAVGATGDDGPTLSNTNSGAVYVFTGSGASWTQQAIVRAGTLSNGSNFGFSVGLDDDTLAIGAILDGGTGAAYVSERASGTWSVPQRLTSLSTTTGDELGHDVDVFGDTLVAGARVGAFGAGHIAIFQRSGSTWAESGCSPVIPFFAGSDDQFGTSVGLDGTSLVGGAPGNDDMAMEAGSATLYTVVPAGDTDNDGLTDALEACVAFGGTCPDPNDADSDGDGLTDGYETLVSGSSPCAADSDGDTVPDGVEVANGTNPNSLDSDSDGWQDNIDNCPTSSNPTQADFDNDGLGDECDPDDDNDGLSDVDEATIGSDPFNPDTDGDTLIDGVEVTLGTDPLMQDSDGDGLSDATEAPLGCPSPTDADSDDDGINDGIEVNTLGLDPCDNDTDGDSLSDGAELDQYFTDPNDSDSDDDNLDDATEIAMGGGMGVCPDPNNPDSDNDGILDGNEVVGSCGPCNSDSDSDGLCDAAEAEAGTNPNDPDSDDDGLLDGAEIATGCTNPLATDSDGDTLSDGAEVIAGTNPCNADSDGDGLPDNVDPMPLTPSVTPTILANMTIATAGGVLDLSSTVFVGPNQNIRQARRAVLAAQIALAGIAINFGQYNAAEALLTLALTRVDGGSPPPDWMTDGSAKTQVRTDLQSLLTLLDLVN